MDIVLNKNKKRIRKFIVVNYPIIYFLLVKRLGKWIIYYIGETTKSTKRLHEHAEDPRKKEWVECGCEYLSIRASTNQDTRKYFEAYMVAKLQPVFLTQKGSYIKTYLFKCLKRRTNKKDKEIVPGYGIYPLLPENIGIKAEIKTWINPKKKSDKAFSCKVPKSRKEELKEYPLPDEVREKDENKRKYRSGTFGLDKITYGEWLINPRTWEGRKKTYWPLNYEEIIKGDKLMQERKERFDKGIMERVKNEIEEISEKERKKVMMEIKSIVRRDPYEVPTQPSIKTEEIILWEKAVGEQKRKRRGMTYEEALAKQKSENMYQHYANNSSGRVLKEIKRNFFQ